MIPLAVPNLIGNEQKYLDQCIETTFVSSVGEFVNRLEDMVAKSTGSKYAVATSAGTTGLHAALTAVGVKPGDLVIIPSFTFIATANAVAHCGAIPWCMDVSADDWCLDPEVVRKELSENTVRMNYYGDDLSTDRRQGGVLDTNVNPGMCEGVFHKESERRVAAIMPVYTLGNIPDMKAFREIADAFDIPLVADAACAIGATYRSSGSDGNTSADGLPFGPLADVSVISFNGNKTVTCGGGGMAVGNNEELMERIRHLTTTARLSPEYDFDMVGFNYRMTNLQAAVGCAQMENLDRFVERKRAVHRFYEEELAGMTWKGKEVSFFPTTDGATCWFSGIVLPEGCGIDDVRHIAAFLKENGIEGRTFWKPVHLQPMYLECPRSELPVTESIWERIVTLPCSTGVTDEELETVVSVVRRVKT